MQTNKRAQNLGRLAGIKRLEKGGLTAFSEMGKKSWDHPSAKREAMQMIRSACSSITALKRRSLKGNEASCTSCKMILSKTKYDMCFHHMDYNRPFLMKILCRRCHAQWHRENKAIAITQEFAEQIVRNKTGGLSANDIARALGIPVASKEEGVGIYYGKVMHS